LYTICISTHVYEYILKYNYILQTFTPDVVKHLILYIYSEEVAEAAVTWELFEAAKLYALPGCRTDAWAASART
jgi:hypothetical protein